MTTLEIILTFLLIPLYGNMFYVTGKINLLEFLLKTIEERIKKHINKEKD